MLINVGEYLKERQAQSPPDLASKWEEIEQLHTNKYVTGNYSKL